MSDDKDRIQFYVANYLEQLNKFPGTWLRAPVPQYSKGDPEEALLYERVVKQTLTALRLADLPHDSKGFTLIMLHELEDRKP